jgi:putative ABC transport system permease protein
MACAMLRHYILTSWRNISRHKFYSIILICGLAVGMASATLLGAYTWRELTVDSFHQKKDRIFLLANSSKDGATEETGGWTQPPAGPAMQQYFPEVESFARMCTWFDEVIINVDDKKFVENGLKGADSSIFNLFTIPFVSGDQKTALKQPNSIVITQSAAKKYFGDSEPMGQTLSFDSFIGTCIVTGVVKDYPDNSHFDFEILVSLSTWKVIEFGFDHWMNHTFVTYVLLNEHSNVSEVNAKMEDFTRANLNPFFIKRYQKTYDELYKNGDYYKLSLVPLNEVHLSTLLYENQEGKKLMVYALGIIAGIILLLVCINYINLATVLSFGRAKEAGIRKVAGSRSRSLFRQFITESIIMAFIGLIICIGLIEITLPLFNALTEVRLTIDYSNPVIVGGLVLFAITIGTLSGFFPAITFASFTPIRALKGNITAQGSRSWMRNGLIIFQFTVCIVMITSTIIVYKQLSYMTNKNTGFSKDQVLVIKRAEGLKTNKTVFKNELLKQSDIKNVSYSQTIPGRQFDGQGQHFAGTPENEFPVVFPLIADKDIFETLGFEILRGKNFSDVDVDNPKAILNEAAVEKLNLTDPFSAVIDKGTMNKPVSVIGIVKDFNFRSFQFKVEPLVILPLNVDNDPQHRAQYILVKIDGSGIKSTLSSIESQWKQFAGNYPFEYSFLDDDFNHLFENEQRMAKVYSLFSLIAISIACLGLLGLMSYFANRRSKEIGIRKIVGASIPNIISLLSRDFVKLLVVSVAIGCTTAWYLANEWIGKFAYQTELTWWIFALAGGLMFVITVTVVGWQLYRAASVNPVETLRYE